MPRVTPRPPLPTAEAIAAWPTSKLLECFVRACEPSFDGRVAALKRLYAAEIDRRIPVPT